MILVDVDGVVCDMFPKWVGLYNAEFGDALDVKDFTNYDDFWRRIPQRATERMAEFLHMGERLYNDTTPEVPGALAALDRLRHYGDRITFVTQSVSSGMFDHKVAWLKRREMLTDADGLIAVLNSTPKRLIRGDVLIDDKPESITDFIRCGGIGILFAQPWNRNDWAPSRMAWEDIEDDGVEGFLRRKVMTAVAA